MNFAYAKRGWALFAALGCVSGLALSTGAHAQALGKAEELTPAEARSGAPQVANDEMGFNADQLLYDNDRNVVTAAGNVVVTRESRVLKADTVTWDRKTGRVFAKGDVSLTNTNGDIAYGDTVEITDDLKDGIVNSLLIVTEKGDRIAADKGERRGAIFILNHAAYSPCEVVDAHGCPKNPTWQVKAARVVYDSDREIVKYRGARMEMFGVPLLPLPGLAHPVGGQGGSGFLVPDVNIDAQNGLEIALPYYFLLAPNRDLIVTPHVYSNVLPMIQGRYRQLFDKGAVEVTSYATVSRRADPTNTFLEQTQDFRGYIDADGKFQLDPYWSITGALRRVTDRTFLNRYHISDDDKLRSTVNAERIGERSYLSIAGWAFQTLRPGSLQGQVPIALPAIDYRLRLKDPWLGGIFQIQANSLAITRTAGQDTQRAFVGAQWTLSRLTRFGQELGLTAYLRGDVYHSGANDLTTTAIYQGQPGWQTRGIAAFAGDMRWPFVGRFLGGTQQITPRVQIVVAPRLKNLSIPNEDSRAVDLEDSNLFALNRFPGYDRFEDSTRITYGFDYRYDRPLLTVEANIGQSYRLNDRDSILPDGTGLSDRLSDFVGRIEVRYADLVSVIERFRLDKDNLAVRRNEFDATLGSRKTYAKISYLRLNRNITSGVEDLRDIEEVRLGGRIAFGKRWSLYGATTVDLTGPSDDPQTPFDGYTPIRHRLGVAYEDDCLSLTFTWQREYQTFGDARQGNSYLVRLAFRNLGI